MNLLFLVVYEVIYGNRSLSFLEIRKAEKNYLYFKAFFSAFTSALLSEIFNQDIKLAIALHCIATLASCIYYYQM